MKVVVEQEVELPDVDVFRTILEDYFEKERNSKSDGWCVFSSFEQFIRCKYQQAMDRKKRKVR